ncbi:IS200/IS605 family accessory protein TnpB-related protein [Persephonella sp.]|uniref:IS200/IS605 family accessory protein TnpB-related protein n=1 Tax=Persephonella sp. TaxID=2060922 RepID=UPI0025D5944D|nr:IS200/IS605 family accessory protein TnpB-related protein [Persephonella sp.]
MITLQCKLTFENEKNKQRLLELMKKFSSCYRYAYNRLLDGHKRKELKKHLQKVFNLNSRYCDDAIHKAQSLINSCKEREQNPKKVIFGGRRLFEKLNKKHINGEKREKLKQKWEERRKGCLYSRGDKTKKGNLNTRIIFEKEGLKLRINTGERDRIQVNIKRTVNRQNDKWTGFIARLLEAEKTGEHFPYSVEIKLINGQIYAFISFEEELPEELIITKEEGIIGIDINAKPFHIALTTLKPDGNLQAISKVSLHELINKTKNQREYLSWRIAHQIVEIAIVQNKAIAIERLYTIPKGNKGDGSKKLRKIKQQWIYRGILEKIKALAKREGIQILEVNPAYTSIIGMLKYAPQYNLDKDTAGAYVIARRGLGFKEKLPTHYKNLILDENFIQYAISKIKEERQKTKEQLKTETKQYKKKPLKRKQKELNTQIKILQNLNSEPQTQQPVNQWEEQVRGYLRSSYKLWQVVKVALTIPVLGKSVPRDLSSLKPILVLGDWDRVVKGLVPTSWGRGYGASEIPPAGECLHLNKAEYKYPSPKCS